MINNAFHPAQALSNASHAVQSTLTTNLEECRERAHLLHDWSELGVYFFAMALVSVLIYCMAVPVAIDRQPGIETHESPQLISEDSAQGRKHREECFVLATGIYAVSWTCAYMLTLVLQFSRFCVAASMDSSVAFAFAILVNVLAWGQLPLGMTAVVNLGRDVWVGKRLAQADRLPPWAIYALPVMAPGYLFLGVIKGVRLLVDGHTRQKVLKMDVEATEAGGSDGMLLPKYAEVDEAADGQEQAAAGAWC
ncbi:hypothetical protein MMC27_002414 [Xylographa pallens]|nr:hypothetical protein [Xylographa pallens]